MTEKYKILKTALISRLFLICLQYIANIAIPDHNAGVFISPKQDNYQIFDKIVFHLFGGFVRWDAHYFMHIANYGYTYENVVAFFPFVPILIRSIALPLSYCIPFLSLDSLMLLTYIITNLIMFMLSSACLYDLSVFILGKKLAYKSAILFCFNPASIFFSAPYTECIYSFLTFKSMLNCILLYKRLSDKPVSYLHSIQFVIPIALSVLTRSNGMLNIGFLVYTIMCLCKKNPKQFKHIFQLVGNLLILILICISPFVLYQFYCYQRFCKDFKTTYPQEIVNYANLNNFILPGMFSRYNQTWCYNKLPLAYSYVQQHYWNVGFLQYYEIKQIPNFLLATPVILIIFNGAFKFFKHYPKDIGQVFNFELLLTKRKELNYEPLMIVFVIHITALIFLSVFNIHVQVITRMVCSASPVLYWFCAIDISQPNPSANNFLKQIFSKHSNAKEKLILCYFFGYYVIGTVLFCNFLPWT